VKVLNKLAIRMASRTSKIIENTSNTGLNNLYARLYGKLEKKNQNSTKNNNNKKNTYHSCCNYKVAKSRPCDLRVERRFNRVDGRVKRCEEEEYIWR